MIPVRLSALLWPRSVRRKLAVPFLGVMGGIALFVYVYFPRAMEHREVDALQARGTNVAAMAAFSVRPGVVFGDTAEIREALQGAFSVREVLAVEVEDHSGALLLQVYPPGQHDPARPPEGDGPPSLASARADVTFDGSVIGRVEVLLSKREMLQQVATLRTTVRTVSIAIFILGMIALWVFGRLVTRPLIGIAKTAELISAGNLGRRAPVTTADEVGQLATAFNVMVDRLQEAQTETERLNRELERRVEERTRHWQKELQNRIRAEAERAQVERFYGQVLDALPLEVAVFDLEGRFVYLNPAGVADPAYRDAMIGARMDEAPDHLRRSDEILSRRMERISEAAASGCLVSLEESLQGPDGELRHFIRVFSPMLAADGSVDKIVGYGVDVTNRKAAEEALRLSEEKLRQSQKMEAVGRLAGGIAHDFNNLLTVITGHTELLLADRHPADPDAEELGQVKRAAERATALTRQLLAFSRRQVLQPRVLELNTVVADIERMLARLIGDHIHLVTVLRPEVSAVRADPGQLEQVLMNMAVNARDAMPQGGSLTIETHTATHLEAEEQYGDHVAPGHYAVLTMRDTGIGISAVDQERIFEPFFTTKEVGKGTGLGLSTVYGIVKQSDGFLFVASRPGLGTAFRIYLPLAGAAPELARPDDTTASRGPSGQRELVLVVEDEAMVRDLAMRILQGAGYRVLDATGGHEALGLIRNHGEELDLLLTDIMMPGLSGTELAERVREFRPDLKVLFMSGYADSALLAHGALTHGGILLQKPFTPERLLQVVRRVLEVHGANAATAVV